MFKVYLAQGREWATVLLAGVLGGAVSRREVPRVNVTLCWTLLLEARRYLYNTLIGSLAV